MLLAAAADVFTVEGSCPPDGRVRANLVCGSEFTLLIDTLSRPSDLEGVRELVRERGRPLLVANSHADWDHWWGNAAFPGVPVIAHRLTLARQHREGRRALAAKRRGDEGFFAGVTLRPATVAFDGRLDLDLGGLHVELRHLPGHTRDCTVAYIPERRLLFAGDAAEDPIPLVTDGPIAGWPEALLDWARRARIVVPAHGRVSGPELLERNAAYLRGLLEVPGSAVSELEGADAFYRRAHRRNLKRAAEEAAIR
ncbi:MAG: MBL fold metallo-hydrolase [Chloroflexi bacterium]|nr:MBL fold metallo-hydrolase [Chloroflexota bacterium]